MKIFITGSDGFLGSHIRSQLVRQGHEIMPFVGDVQDYAQLKNALSQSAFDFVIHLAGVSSVPQAEQDLGRLFGVNTLGTNLLLEALLATKQKAELIFASSAQVYAQSNSRKPLTEDSEVGPHNAYGRSKYASEVLIRGYSEAYGVDAAIFRIFNHTHKTQNVEFFLPSIYHKCLEAKSKGLNRLSVAAGNLNLIRDINPIQNMVEAFDKYILHAQKKNKCEIYNICGSGGFALRDLAMSMGKSMNLELEFVVDEARLRATDPDFFVGDDTKLRQFLNLNRPNRLSPESVVKMFHEDILTK